MTADQVYAVIKDLEKLGIEAQLKVHTTECKPSTGGHPEILTMPSGQSMLRLSRQVGLTYIPVENITRIEAI